MYDLVSYITRGRTRLEVLENLGKPMTPTQLAEKISNHRSTVSRTLLDLQKKGLINCITPNEKLGRYYEISKLGKKVMAVIQNE